MTQGQFFLALVTIFVATVVYRWQKSVDRQTEQKKMLSKLYADYIAQVSEHSARQPMIGDHDAEQKAKEFASIGEHEQKVYVLRDQIYLLAPENVVEKLSVCDRAFREWKITFNRNNSDPEQHKTDVKNAFDNFRSNKNILLPTMRKDLARHASFVNVPALPKIFGTRKRN